MWHDVDEYMTLNEKFVNDWEKLMSAPGGVATVFQHLRQQVPIPKHYNTSYVNIPRAFFGTVNSTEEDIRHGVPKAPCGGV